METKECSENINIDSSKECWDYFDQINFTREFIKLYIWEDNEFEKLLSEKEIKEISSIFELHTKNLQSNYTYEELTKIINDHKIGIDNFEEKYKLIRKIISIIKKKK